MTIKQSISAQGWKTAAQLKREIAWLKRQVKIREGVLAVKETKEGIK